MRILLVVDGSSYSDMATMTLGALHLPPQTEVTVLTVIPEHSLLGGITLEMLKGSAPVKKKIQEKEATKLLSGPVKKLSANGLKVREPVTLGKSCSSDFGSG